MLLRLRLDQMALQPGQGRIPFCYRQSQRFRRVFGRRAPADADLVQLYSALRSAQFHHDPPLHLALPAQRQQVGPYTPRWTIRGPIARHSSAVAGVSDAGIATLTGGPAPSVGANLVPISGVSPPTFSTVSTEQSGRTGNADEAPAVAPRGRRGVGRTAGASHADRPVSSIVQRYVTLYNDAKRTVKLKRHAGQAASDTAMVRTDPRLTQCAGVRARASRAALRAPASRLWPLTPSH